MLARPFLATPKSRLVATLKAAGVDFLSDPSNERECYERVRLRHARAALEALGLTSERLALSARRLLRAKDAIESAVDTFIEAEVTLNGGAFALVAREAFAALEAEAKVRVLARLVRAFGGTTPEARLSQVEVLARDVGAGRSRLAVTLGGAIVSAGERAMRIYREPGRGVAHEIELRSGEEAVWDERFCVSFEALSAQGRSAPQVVIVRALGSEAYATLARSGVALTPMPARAAVGLPAFWSGERLISVPHLILPHGTLEDVAGSCRAVFIGCKRGAC